LGEKEVRITIGNSGVAANLLGQQDRNLRFIEENLKAEIVARGSEVIISGDIEDVKLAERLFRQLLSIAETGQTIDINLINYTLNMLKEEHPVKSSVLTNVLSEPIFVTPRGKLIKPKTMGQHKYIQAIASHDLVFGIGPAGTGKTYLAVVMAVKALKNKSVSRIILVRPAVEAGEKLGFLPGDLQEKINPYLRPLYDGLYDVLGLETAGKYMERGIIEVAPLAYMRGRTLDDSFIILDEAQNTTPEQMKMLVTRIGFGSKAVITGDITQVDLPRGESSGLMQAQEILSGIDGISFQYLSHKDVVRHPLVQKIIQAYESHRINSGGGDKLGK
jgi:phosphate starvation-inducible PhoH-like protein